MPYWSYWMWGFIGGMLLWWGWGTLFYKDEEQHTHVDMDGVVLCIIGLFFIYYWLNKIGIVPMRFWEFNDYFYKF